MIRMKKQVRTPLRMSAEWYMKDSLLKRFDREIDPEGNKWAPLVKKTQRERIQQGYKPKHPILKRIGNLRGSFYRDFVGPHKIKIDNRMEKAKKLHIKRKFLGFNRYDSIGVKKIFVKWSYDTLIKNL